MHVRTDDTRCIGSGQCVMAAPGVFDQDDEVGLVVLLRAEPDPAEEDQVRQAASLCPAYAIAVDET